MKGFFSSHSQDKSIKGGSFATVKEAKDKVAELGRDKVVNSTLGVLFNDEGEIITFDSVWESYDSIPRNNKAGYAESMAGNKGFLKAVDEWVFQGVNKEFYTNVTASPGGTGALNNTIWNTLDAGNSLLLPEICWGVYKLMAREFSLKAKTYSLFSDKDGFDTKDFLSKCQDIMDKEGKVLAIINDPCHNPTGYSMSIEEWNDVITGLNKISKAGPVILINDIAYLDFSFKSPSESRKYMENFNNIGDNLLVVQTFSISKSLTSYGLRVGAQIAISKNKDLLETFRKTSEFSCRSTWSNVPNGAMRILPQLVENPEMKNTYEGERQGFIKILEERQEVFTREAKECGLPLYPYKEGFFATVKVEEDRLDDIYQGLKDANIYTIKQPIGIRIALCGVSKIQLTGLASKIQNVIENV